MAICEDAPCCGCCGPNIWAAELRSEAEYRESPEWLFDQDEWYDDGEIPEDCCELGDESGRVFTSWKAFGYAVEETAWSCSYCGEHTKVTFSPAPYLPDWMERNGFVHRLTYRANRRAALLRAMSA